MLRARAEVEVVRVGEDDPRAELRQLARTHGLDGGLRADGHEAGRLDLAVRRLETPDPRAPVTRLDAKREAFGGHGGVRRHSASIASPRL